jgi:hypothetical protein
VSSPPASRGQRRHFGPRPIRWAMREPPTPMLLGLRKKAASPGEGLAARDPVGGKGDTGSRWLLRHLAQREVAVAVVVRGPPSATQTLGSVCDCRLTKW